MDNGRQHNTPRARHTTEQIIGELREAEVVLSQGQTIGQIAAIARVDDLIFTTANTTGYEGFQVLTTEAWRA